MTKKNYDGPERRFFKRLSVNLPVQFSFLDAQGGEEQGLDFKEAFTVDISGGGMALQLEELSEELTKKLLSGLVRIGVKFRIPDNPLVVKVLAKAVWITKHYEQKTGKLYYLIGMQFIDITENNRDKIIDFVVNRFLDKENRTEDS